MLTAIISALTGVFSGIIPDVLKEITSTRSHTRELEFLRLQHQFSMERLKAESDDKMHAAEQTQVAEEVRALREHLTAIIEYQGRPTGIAWIDGFNAILRPATAALVLLLFVWISSVFISGVVQQYSSGGIADPQTFANVIWGSMVGEAVQATLGFLFGYRSAVKKV